MIPAPRRDNTRRFVAGIVVSVLAHLLLFLALFVWTPDIPENRQRDRVALEIIDKTPSRVSGQVPRQDDPDRIEDSDRLDGQVVSLPRPEVEQKPEDARFLSKYDIKVDKEQVARHRPGKPGRPGKKKSRAGIAGKSAGPASEPVAARPDTSGEDSSDVESKSPSKPVIEHKMPSLRGLGNLLLPGGSAGGRGSSLNMRMLAEQTVVDGSLASAGQFVGPGGQGGQGGSDDVFMGVEDEGDVTLVNSRSFKYWDFFDRIKSQVKSEWDPGPVYRSRDPNGNAFGKRDRYTILSVVLDRSGAVAQLEVAHKSGLDFLDEEAVRAFSAAGPFTNPPTGLIDDRGRIVFRFGFLLEFGSASGSFFWQRP